MHAKSTEIQRNHRLCRVCNRPIFGRKAQAVHCTNWCAIGIKSGTTYDNERKMYVRLGATLNHNFAPTRYGNWQFAIHAEQANGDYFVRSAETTYDLANKAARLFIRGGMAYIALFVLYNGAWRRLKDYYPPIDINRL